MALRSKTLIANRARRLRRDLTEPEVMLWSRLRRRAGRDIPVFRRQYALGNFILDFYCPAAKLAVEIDGATHWSDEQQVKDERRDWWLGQQGVSVMRVAAGDVYSDLDQVSDAILRRAAELIGKRKGSG